MQLRTWPRLTSRTLAALEVASPDLAKLGLDRGLGNRV